MTTPSPFESNPPSRTRVLWSVLAALAGAAILLIAVVLPAEYGIDPTGLGRALGLHALGEPTRTLQIKDVIGGNETYRNVNIVDVGDPVPLPNPAVFQGQPTAARSETRTVRLEPGQQTEIKAVLAAAQVVVYSWSADGGEVYADFHGHEPGAGEVFVRYREIESGREDHGSLVAPFAGEHGWYWMNLADTPVTIELQLTGYHREVVDYGLL
jgi:hypothetical protein